MTMHPSKRLGGLRVKLEPRSLSRLAVPLRALVERFAFVSLLGTAIALLLLSRAEVGLVGFINMRIADAVTPILSVMGEPVAASRRIADQVGGLAAVHEENARLREQNRQLLEWQGVARQLALENRALRQMLNMDAEAARPTAVVARVVADGGGPFMHTVLVDAGSDQGVVKGMAAVDARGLIGRVIEVGRRSARLLLLIDLNSRIPVMVERSRDQAILSGDNSRQPKLLFLPLNPRFSVGDRVVTSGRGGLLPPGLGIGKVSAITEDRAVVTTQVDWDRIEYVRLLEFAPVAAPASGGAADEDLYGPPPPPGLQVPGGEVAAGPAMQGTAAGARPSP
jgi:rod shape-determining protein MreC